MVVMPLLLINISGAIGMIGRGIDEHISTLNNLWLDDTKCIQCGQCTLICPTGAMREANEIFDVLDKLSDSSLIKASGSRSCVFY